MICQFSTLPEDVEGLSQLVEDKDGGIFFQLKANRELAWNTLQSKSIQSKNRPESSSAATAVELENAEAPFRTPRSTRPSRLYASTGALNNSTKPDTNINISVEEIIWNKY